MQAEERAPDRDRLVVRTRVLVRLALALALLLALFAASNYRAFAARRDEDVRRTADHALKLLRRATLDSVGAMRVVAGVVSRDPILVEAMLRGDRAALLERAAPVLRDLREHAGISHLYFHGVDRVNVLRVHEPDHHGDEISRFTLLEAERTGAPSSGNEQGPFGTYTLRYVVPWRDGERLIGYLELGSELEDIANVLHQSEGVDLVVLVDKGYVRREMWERAAAGKERLPPWDALPSLVAVFSTVEALPAEVSARLARQGFAFDDRLPVHAGGRTFQSTLLPIDDARGRETSRLLVLRDVTAMTASVREQLLAGCATFAGVSALLIAAFYVFLGRIQQHLRERSRRLSQTNEQLEHEAAERAVAQAELEKALRAAEVASRAIGDSLAEREEALGALRVAKLDLELQLRTIEQQRLAIHDLSVPVIDVWDGILTLPLVGPVDSERAAAMTEQLLRRVVEASARWVIIDLTGLPAVDVAVTEHFARVAKAVRLLGCGCVMTGISASVAHAFVRLGVQLEGIRSMRTLKEGVRYCLSASEARRLRTAAAGG